METETTKGNEPTVMKSIVKGTLNAVYNNGELLKQYILCLVRRTVTNAQVDEAIDQFHLENELDNARYIYDDIDTKISSFESKVKEYSGYGIFEEHDKTCKLDEYIEKASDSLDKASALADDIIKQGSGVSKRNQLSNLKSYLRDSVVNLRNAVGFIIAKVEGCSYEDLIKHFYKQRDYESVNKVNAIKTDYNYSLTSGLYWHTA